MNYQAFEFPLEIQEEVEEIGLAEVAIRFNLLPSSIVFYLPRSRGYVTVPFAKEYEEQYRQLVCWCNYARYWYYVIHQPKFYDLEYDFLELLVKRFEEDCNVSNKYSPSNKPGSSSVFSYPKNIQQDFFNYST